MFEYVQKLTLEGLESRTVIMEDLEGAINGELVWELMPSGENELFPNPGEKFDCERDSLFLSTRVDPKERLE